MFIALCLISIEKLDGNVYWSIFDKHRALDGNAYNYMFDKYRKIGWKCLLLCV